MNAMDTFPVVLCLSGFDPSGGAGIGADIEALSSQGCQACGAITAMTVQNSRDVISVHPVDPNVIIQQARAVLEDMPVAVIKIGLVGSVEVAAAIHSVLSDYPDIPVVLDPVLASGGSGRALADDGLVEAILNLLVPQATLITPNLREAHTLIAGADTRQATAIGLMEAGAQSVLLTGGDEPGDDVLNTLFAEQRWVRDYHWPRLPHQYHGSGCTLAASAAGLIAHGILLEEAVEGAQEYTWNALYNAVRLGMGQHQPDRFFWTLDATEEDIEDNDDNASLSHGGHGNTTLQ